MENIEIKVTKLSDITILEDINDDNYFKFVCFGKIKLNEEEIEFEFTEEDGVGVSLRIKNQDGKLEKVNQYENLNYRIIDDIFSQSTSDYKDLKVGDFWDLKFDKKLIEPILKKYQLVDFNKVNTQDFLNNLNVDKSVEVSDVVGGYNAAKSRLDLFAKKGFNDYSKLRSHPSEDASSQLSPYFHFGHISTYEVFEKIISSESWSVENIDPNFVGRREGWWGGSANLESFFDELITWRELGYHTCVKRANYDQYQSLPDWAIKTLDDHANDEREYIYDLSEFTNANTHDEIWNAAQNQLKTEGRIHNYLRMLWGKKILEWTPNPQIALSYLIDLNDRFALDGRDPNSYSGVFWILGRYDRAWGPERPIYGKIRYMTSKSTATKFNLKPYLEKWSVGSTV